MRDETPNRVIHLDTKEIAVLSTVVERALSHGLGEPPLEDAERKVLRQLAFRLRSEPSPTEPRSVQIAREGQKFLGILAVLLLITVLPPLLLWYFTGSLLWASMALALGACFAVIGLGSLMGKVSWGMGIVSLLVLLAFYGLAVLILAAV